MNKQTIKTAVSKAVSSFTDYTNSPEVSKANLVMNATTITVNTLLVLFHPNPKRKAMAGVGVACGLASLALEAHRAKLARQATNESVLYYTPMQVAESAVRTKNTYAHARFHLIANGNRVEDSIEAIDAAVRTARVGLAELEQMDDHATRSHQRQILMVLVEEQEALRNDIENFLPR